MTAKTIRDRDRKAAMDMYKNKLSKMTLAELDTAWNIARRELNKDCSDDLKVEA